MRLKFNDFDSSFQARAIYYSKLGGSGTYKGSASQNRWLIQKMKEMGYKSGTFSATKGLHWTQENGDEIIIRKSDGAMLTPLNSGDMVLNNEASKKLWEFSQDPEGYMAKLGIKDIMPNFNIKVLDYSNLPIKNNTMQSVNNDIQMNITLPNVKNYDEFKGNLIKDRQFEEAIQSMTLGNALGHNSLNKYRH